MKLFGARLFLAVMFAMSLAHAAAGQTRHKAFKGWELYSWLDRAEWRFSLHQPAQVLRRDQEPEGGDDSE